MLLAIGAILVLGALAVAIVFFGGFVDTPETGTDQESPVSTKGPTPTDAVTFTTAPMPTATLSPTLTSTPTAIPVTETSPPTSTATPTPTTTPVSLENYKIFLASFDNQLSLKPVVPIRFRGGRITRHEKLFLVYNATAESDNGLQRLREKNGIISAYAQTVLFHKQGKLSGKAPTGMRVLEVDNTDQPSKTFYVNDSVALKFSTGQINAPEYESTVYETLRNQTQSEQEVAAEIDRLNANYTFYNGTIEKTDEK